MEMLKSQLAKKFLIRKISLRCRSSLGVRGMETSWKAGLARSFVGTRAKNSVGYHV